MCMKGTIWDEHVFGLTFDGKQGNLYGEAFRVDENTPLVLFECPKNGNAGEADKFLQEKGFNMFERYNLDGKSDAEIETYLQSLTCKENCVVIVAQDRLLSICGKLLKRYGIRFQLFSRIRWFFNLFRPNLRKVYGLLEDDYSKEVFTTVLGVRYKILPDKALWPYYTPNQYFAPFEMNVFDPEEVFVDCGSFVGDILENYIRMRQNNFKRIYAFEPGEKQYKALQERVKRLQAEWALREDQIQCIPYGVGAQSMKMSIEQGENGEMTSMHIVKHEAGRHNVQIVDLDTYLQDEPRIGFIKSDIEGFEMEMLRGATRIIQRDKPLLAITLYHKLTDYYEIPLYIHEIVPEYKFKILHHYFNWWETVLYAYVDR